MKYAWVVVGLSLASAVRAGSPCGAVIEPSNRAGHWLIGSTDWVTLYRCSASTCDQVVGTMPRLALWEKLADGLATEKAAIEKVSDCVEKRMLEEDELFSRLQSLTQEEKATLAARHYVTMAETAAWRARLTALKNAVTGGPATDRFSSLRLFLTVEKEPLLHRLALEAFR